MLRDNTWLSRINWARQRMFKLQPRRLGLRLVLWSAVICFQLWHGPLAPPAYAADVGMISAADEAPATTTHSDAAATTTASKWTHVGSYFGLSGGYALTDYVKQFGGHNNWDQGVGQLTLGAYAGYQFRKQLALELGYQYIFSAKAHNEAVAAAGSYSKIRPQLIYGVLKMTAAIHPKIDFFAKVGLAYVRQSVSQHGLGGNGAIAQQERTRAHVGGAFGAGVSYMFTQRLFADMSYMFVSGEFKASQDQLSRLTYQIPSINLFMISVGYSLGS